MKSPRSPSASAGLFTCGECCAVASPRRGSVASPRLRAWTSLARGSESHQPPLHEKPAVALVRLASAPEDSLRRAPKKASKLRSRLRALQSRARAFSIAERVAPRACARAADPWLRHVSGLGPRLREVANPTNLRFMKSPRSRWCDLPRPLRIHSERSRPERAKAKRVASAAITSAERSEAREDDVWRRCASRVASPLVMAKLGSDARHIDVR
jgi:hypothetical protein